MVRSEEAERAVAPVVGELAPGDRGLVHGFVDWEEFHGGDAELAKMGDGGFVGESGEGAAVFFWDLEELLGEAFDVELVEDRVVPGDFGRVVVFPVEGVVDDNAFGDSEGVVGLVEDKVESLVKPIEGIIHPDATIEQLRQIFAQDNVAVVVASGKVVGIITKIDLIDYLARRQ